MFIRVHLWLDSYPCKRSDLRTSTLPLPPKTLDKREIVHLRETLNFSQGVFARHLNVSVKTVESRADPSPTGDLARIGIADGDGSMVAGARAARLRLGHGNPAIRCKPERGQARLPDCKLLTCFVLSQLDHHSRSMSRDEQTK